MWMVHEPDNYIRIIIGHPNLHPKQLLTASINTAINCDREGVILVSHYFVMSIKGMDPIRSSSSEMAFLLFLLKQGALFSRVSGSTLYITVCTKSRGILKL